MRCTKCDTLIAHHAKYCPKCGERPPRPGSVDLPRAPDALPSNAPLPRQGKVFLVLLGLAVATLGLGIVGRVGLMMYVGAGLLVLLMLVLLVGDLVGL